MIRDRRNNYAVFWRGRYVAEVRGYRDALAARHDLAESEGRKCLTQCVHGFGPLTILDTPASSECCCCSCYCKATLSKELPL